jgi:hypothetical protein
VRARVDEEVVSQLIRAVRSNGGFFPGSGGIRSDGCGSVRDPMTTLGPFRVKIRSELGEEAAVSDAAGDLLIDRPIERPLRQIVSHGLSAHRHKSDRTGVDERLHGRLLRDIGRFRPLRRP